MNTLTERLLTEQNECTLSWQTANNHPAATIVSFVYLNDRICMTALAGSARVRALQRNPKACVVISGKGSPVGHSRCVSIQGSCEIVEDQVIRDRFFPLFASAVLPNSEKGAEMMANMMNSPENLLLAVSIEKTFPYDAQSMLDQANQM